MAPPIQVARKTPSNRIHLRPVKNRKFMQTLSVDTFATLEAISRSRGVSLQELLRAQVIPDWLRSHRNETK
jgi:hypothetical protein